MPGQRPTPHALSTVAAVATASGPGAIGIVRISGPRARAIGELLFLPQSPHFRGFEPARMHLGAIRNPETGAILDQALVVLFPAPHSFTGEDVLEIHAHGSPLLLRQILQVCFALGAEPAPAGEFSRRAFLHGKLDLTQAEAIAEVIAATSPLALSQASERLHGQLASAIEQLREALLALRAELLVAVDFPEEDLPELTPEAIHRRLAAVLDPVETLLAAAHRGTLAREGAVVPLAGRVNAGKSSLLNALVGRERAIVSPLAGTTRDTIEETILVAGLPVRLVDTAGLRESADPIEAEGIARACAAYEAAHLMLLVLDATSVPDEHDRSICAHGKPVIVVVNKMDLVPTLPPWAKELPWSAHPVVGISAVTGTGLEELLAEIARLLEVSSPTHGTLTPNERQARHLAAARKELQHLAQGATHLPPDILAIHLDAAVQELEAILGRTTPDEVLDAVFARLCIGK